MKESSFTLKQIESMTGIPASTWRDFLKRDVTPSQRTVNKIANIIHQFCAIKGTANSIGKTVTNETTIKAKEPKEVYLHTKETSKEFKPVNPTGKLSAEEVEERVKNSGITSCPKCNAYVRPKYSKKNDNWFLGCTRYKPEHGNCRWTTNLTDKYSDQKMTG